MSCKFTDQSESFRLGTKALIGQEGCGEKSLVQSSELDFTHLRSTLLITWRSTFPLLILGLNDFLVIQIFMPGIRDFFFWFWAPFWAHLFYFAKIRNSYAAADGIWFERKLLTTWDPVYSGCLKFPFSTENFSPSWKKNVLSKSKLSALQNGENL